MKILFLDWLRWVYPKEPHILKGFLEREGVVCKDILPATRDIRGQKLSIIGNPNTPKYYRGFNLDEFIKVPVIRETGWYEERPDIIQKYRDEAAWYIDWAADILQKECPNYILLEGGLTHFGRVCAEVARNLDIGVIAIENTFIKSKMLMEFETGCICNRFSFAKNVKDYLSCRYITPKMCREVAIIVNEVFTKDLSYPTREHFDFSKYSDKKIMFVPLQVWHDQVVLHDTKFNNEEFIEEVLDLATSFFEDWIVILKCHPKEEKVAWQRNTGDWLSKKELPGNVLVIRDGLFNTQDLIRGSDLVVVNNSQTGLEAALLGKPVVVTGNAYYGNCGFTIQCDDFSDPFWIDIEKRHKDYVDMDKANLFFWYFYKELYDKFLSVRDRGRIKRRLGL